jgi:hypothetical protein
MLALLQALAGAIAALASLFAALRAERRRADDARTAGKSAAFDKLARAIAARRKALAGAPDGAGGADAAGAGGLPHDRYRRD